MAQPEPVSDLRRSESHFTAAGGRELFRRAWLPRTPERVLLLAHGYGEHSGRYEHVGAWFAARGCAVHAYDHQGHGRSSGLRCHVRRFGDFLDDLEVVLSLVGSEHPGLPLFAVGHSMGGLIVCALAVERQPELAGAITSGAPLALPPQVSRRRLLAGRVLRALRPRLSLASGIDPEGLSRDPEVVRAYVEDPLVQNRLTASLGTELIGAVGRVAEGASRVRVPMLMLHGEADPLCPVEASRRFFERLDVPMRRLRTYPGLRHEIFNEPERESVFEDLLGWCREAEPGRVHPS